MPKITGIFDLFDNLESIPIEDIARWIKPVPNPIALENFVANRILYPQALALSLQDMSIDMAILREGLSRNRIFFDEKTHKIIIPESFNNRAPSLAQLAWVFIDAYLIGWVPKNPGQNIFTVLLRSDDRDQPIGSVILPEFSNGQGVVDITVNDKKFQVKQGGLTAIPCNLNHCIINYQVTQGNILGVPEGSIQIAGGLLGVIVDGRGI